MKNELATLIAEQAADMAGTVSGSRGDRVKGIVRSDTRRMDRQLAEGAELTAHREALLARYPFRTRRERRIYRLHAEGLTDREIAKRMHRTKVVTQRLIAKVERSVYIEAYVPLHHIRVWSYYLQGWHECHIARRCSCPPEYVREVVTGAVKGWRNRHPPESMEYATACDEGFLARLGSLTPSAVLEAAQRDPELAEMLTSMWVS
jgi:hypothetical protein